MKTFFATFGCGKPFRSTYVGIVAGDEPEARAAMFECFHQKWAFMYSAKRDLAKQVLDFGYTPLLFIHVEPERFEGQPMYDRVRRIDESIFTNSMNVEVDDD